MVLHDQRWYKKTAKELQIRRQTSSHNLSKVHAEIMVGKMMQKRREHVRKRCLTNAKIRRKTN